MDKRLIFPLLLVLFFLGCNKKPEAPQPEASNEQTYYEESAEQDSETQEDQETTSLSSYEYTWTGSEDMPNVIIIIDDFGNSAGQLLEDFADLPQEIVFAVLPDLSHSKTAAELASRKGHEVIIHIPMEAENSSISPGAKYISKAMAEQDIKATLNDFIAQMPMAIAANNHMGSATTANLSTMSNVLEHLDKNGLFFIDSATTSKSAVATAANALGIFSSRRDIFLDVPDSSEQTLASKIQSLGKYKGRKEPIVIITHCHNREKLDALQKFIAQIQSMGLNLVSLKDAFPQSGA
jgi:polysaccharide deacetylase 2 family uncharacterized protein YibQ